MRPCSQIPKSLPINSSHSPEIALQSSWLCCFFRPLALSLSLSLFLFSPFGCRFLIHLSSLHRQGERQTESTPGTFSQNMQHMDSEGKQSSIKALEGVHGVQLVPHWPFMIQDIPQDANFSTSCKHNDTTTANHKILMQRIWQMRPPSLTPIHCSHQGDRCVAETIANVLTSLPFIFFGIQAPRRNLTSTLYANSLIGVGVVSSLYHSSRGKVRKYLRWADYTMIATATICLSRALRNENPRFLMAASALCLPFQPLIVSAVHTGMMEVAFARRASTKPELRTAHSLHTLSSALGGALFIADDLFPETPYLHAAWHLAAAIGVGTCNKLLE